ncbi:hypothetical protein OO17_27995 [Rhodopseudomonas palustris]|uniref:Uncharacterized protein n=1 Tax=Rhodopseudomonas palustris TaxID=1076 RepID=A0A0D7E2I3_RHOPL|nr:hypothetical protein OO17_27995 [Rhodopseudomonas palustris]
MSATFDLDLVAGLFGAALAFATAFFAAAGLEVFLRVCLDIRLPFVAFRGSIIAGLLMERRGKPLLGKSADLGVWLQGFETPAIPVC